MSPTKADDVLSANPDSDHHNGGRKIRHLVFCPKIQFSSYNSISKHISPTSLKHSQTISSTPNTQKMVQKPEIKPI
jgi:hypothetical protein